MRISAAVYIVSLLSIRVALQGADSISAPANASPEPTFRLNSELVIVPVTVTDRAGKSVQDLRSINFSVTDEQAQQEISSFSHEDTPVSIGIVFDVSNSMKNKIAIAQTALYEFLRTVEPGDEMFLVTFSDRTVLRTDFSSDDSAIQSELSFERPKGSTALFDAVALALRQMRTARNERKVLLVISDGGDNHSRLTEKELGRILKETEVQIHSLGIHDSGFREEMRGERILGSLSETTGGEHYMVRHANELPQLAARVSLSLHDRYVLTYRPNCIGTPAKWHKIRVTLRGLNGRYQVYARAGYRTQR
jgi:Ca-activated chloride channel family protein